MSTLYINEYKDMPVSSGKFISAPQEPALASQNVTYTGTAGVSSAFNANTRFIGVSSDGIFSYLVSSAGTSATTANFRVPAGTIVYLGVIPTHKISAITNT
jgi:hypothetical protein